jgi:nitrate reductase gamma subunit
MSDMDFLLWVRGPGFTIALSIFCFGVLLRLFEILMLGQRHDYAEARASGMEGGMRTVWRRFLPAAGTFKTNSFTIITGYAFHLGLFVSIFLFAPHIEIIHNVIGVSWPALPSPVVDFTVVVALVALLAILFRRLTHPVMRQLSSTGDYIVWLVTFLPLLTGYLTYHHLLLPYTQMLAWHIVSVELLLIVFPFTKLMHTFTLFLARFYTGAVAGRKGVEI